MIGSRQKPINGMMIQLHTTPSASKKVDDTGYESQRVERRIINQESFPIFASNTGNLP
jgi:hypothetical protein